MHEQPSVLPASSVQQLALSIRQHKDYASIIILIVKYKPVTEHKGTAQKQSVNTGTQYSLGKSLLRFLCRSQVMLTTRGKMYIIVIY